MQTGARVHPPTQHRPQREPDATPRRAVSQTERARGSRRRSPATTTMPTAPGVCDDVGHDSGGGSDAGFADAMVARNVNRAAPSKAEQWPSKPPPADVDFASHPAAASSVSGEVDALEPDLTQHQAEENVRTPSLLCESIRLTVHCREQAQTTATDVPREAHQKRDVPARASLRDTNVARSGLPRRWRRAGRVIIVAVTSRRRPCRSRVATPTTYVGLWIETVPMAPYRRRSLI
jgi:hypothetical protein